MSFVVRAALPEDVGPLYQLAKQFTLINLPADPSRIEAKVERSRQSFAGQLTKDDAEYLFVVEDTRVNKVIGSSLILAKNGTAREPNYALRIDVEERRSRELGIEFSHRVLRLTAHTDGPTEVGGLVVDREYRRRPEKVGRMASVARFVYIGMRPDRFENELHAEMAPPFDADGRSDFWEALGFRFTGLPYAEADRISGKNNRFIPELFPSEGVYLALLDGAAQSALGRVGPETEAAHQLLHRVGFRFKNEVDPFDGGPHLGCSTADCRLIQDLGRAVPARGGGAFEKEGFVGVNRDSGFIGTASPYQWEGQELRLPDATWEGLALEPGEEIFVTPLP